MTSYVRRKENLVLPLGSALGSSGARMFSESLPAWGRRSGRAVFSRGDQVSLVRPDGRYFLVLIFHSLSPCSSVNSLFKIYLNSKSKVWV